MSASGKSKVPASVYDNCIECGQTLHRVLKGRSGGRMASLVLECGKCGRVSRIQMPTSRDKKVPLIISWLSESEKSQIALDSSESVTLGDEYVVNGSTVKITGIESRGRRPRKCRVSEVDTLWATRFDQVRVHVSLRLSRGRTRSSDFLALPDDEFSVGDTIDIDGREITIYSIKTGGGPIRMGSAKAMDIVRVYAEYPKKADFSRRKS